MTYIDTVSDKGKDKFYSVLIKWSVELNAVAEVKRFRKTRAHCWRWAPGAGRWGTAPSPAPVAAMLLLLVSTLISSPGNDAFTRGARDGVLALALAPS